MPFKNPLPMKLSVKGWNLKNERKVKIVVEKREITVITVKNKMAGYLQVEDRSKTLYLRMIVILPQYQGSGIGSRILKSLIDSATRQEKDVDLQVFKINPAARRFYERLGFEVEEEAATHDRMRRKLD